jgi:hypothetical protein
MDLSVFLASWLYLILVVYLVLLVVVAVRRVVRGKAATESAIVSIRDGHAEIRQGADPATLVGLFLIAASFLWISVGVAVGAAAISMLQTLPMGFASTPGLFYIGLAAFAVFLILWSTWLGFGVWGVAIDRDAKTVTTWWGLMRPWRRRVRPLGDFSSVAVRLGPRRGIRARSFTVGLEGNHKPVLLDRGTWQNREQAMDLGKQVADVTGLTLKDHTVD